ncbi:hypothetical protein K438DRAFT_2145730 [Mycena galopus ATCC 62051]|nr:hypothetical protein K438DRAFT_2145730 [Mycena galopus ATCC 62051]
MRADGSELVHTTAIVKNSIELLSDLGGDHPSRTPLAIHSGILLTSDLRRKVYPFTRKMWADVRLIFAQQRISHKARQGPPSPPPRCAPPIQSHGRFTNQSPLTASGTDYKLQFNLGGGAENGWLNEVIRSNGVAQSGLVDSKRTTTTKKEKIHFKNCRRRNERRRCSLQARLELSSPSRRPGKGAPGAIVLPSVDKDAWQVVRVFLPSSRKARRYYYATASFS